MTITARVHNHSIALPANVMVPEGAAVQVTLPEQAPPVQEDGDALAWMEEFAGVLDSLPAEAAARHTERAHGRKRQAP